MSPDERYDALLDAPGFVDDPAQRAIVHRLTTLSRTLEERDPRRAGGSIGSIWRRISGRAIEPIRGIYLWGGVGRGKTFLMDLFFEALPFQDKLRLHFHRFMQRVHRDLTRHAGHPNPLETVADDIVSEARVLCFDEFFVSDIGDAMILAGLLRALFHRGVTLVATSNQPPIGLYPNGLQRSRFVPAIALLETHTEVVHLDTAVDYRLRVLERAEIYHCPLDDAADESLSASFRALAPDGAAVQSDTALEVDGRLIRCRKNADDVAWFDFVALCDGPRSQSDYIELAREYHAVLVSGVPVFTTRMEDQARRFISLVDEFYDRNVKLILSAAAQVDQLYRGERLAFEFARTRSRLLEMQSHAYLERTHRG
jgi:cell division protein ZapE